MRQPVATPYIRWSSDEQSSGDSRRRQESLFDQWHAANPEYIRAPALIDAGVSGFRGTAAQPELVQYVQDIRDGKVQPGDVLGAESWDRISRDQPFDADEVIREIWNSGVGIVITSERVLYSKETMRKDPFQYMRRLLDGIQAHDYSRRLS
jgi:DNA invertase Pin-like site-specific DNA recombinase